MTLLKEEGHAPGWQGLPDGDQPGRDGSARERRAPRDDLAHLPRSAVIGPGRLRWRVRADPTLPRFDATARREWVGSGRVALYHALRALGVAPGVTVLVPTYHCPTMVEPVVLLGARPLFYPLAPDGRPDLDALRAMGPRPAAVLVAAHYFGRPLDFAALAGWCRDAGVALIEDCAHAFLGAWHERGVGTVGDMAIASLPKCFAVNEGGCVRARGDLPLPDLSEPGWAAEVRALWDAVQVSAQSGRLGSLTPLVNGVARLRGWWRRGPTAPDPAQADAAEAPPADVADVHERPSDDPAYHTIERAGIDHRPSRWSRFVVRHSDVGQIAELRRRNYMGYVQRLAGAVGLRALHDDLPAGAVPYVFPVFVDRAREVYPRLRARGVPVFRWDVLWPGTPRLAQDTGRLWSDHVLQMACHQDLTPDDIAAVAAALADEARSVASRFRPAVPPAEGG